jgi:TolB-like protein/tetratricopeptide (TPR) repeat protein
MVKIMSNESGFFITGGTLRSNAPSYVERRADSELLEGLRKGQFCYVLTARQMGKSSLMVQTTARLRDHGVNVVALDLTAIGQNVTPDQWYNGLLARTGRQLGLEDELDDYWNLHAGVSPVQRFMSAIQDLVMTQRPGRLVIFVDEIDSVRSLPFSTDEFFGAIRECYNRRVEDPGFENLTFCLLGVATPADLIRDNRNTPFNIGRRIELTDFTREEAAPLARGLRVRKADAILNRVLFWTNGHPFLTQRHCETILARPNVNEPEHVDDLCMELFLSREARERDDNLLYVRDRIVRSEVDLSSLLETYSRIHEGQQVQHDETNPLLDVLLLSGISRVINGAHHVRNRIYFQVFDRRWVNAHKPPAVQARPLSIAVLPFANMSSNPENEYFSDGITEDLITALAQVDGLRVLSRTTTFSFKGQGGDVRRIGKQLNVSHLLEGSVRMSQKRLRIGVQLLDVSDGNQIWSDRFDRDMTDVFEIQDEISQAIVQSLKVKLIGDSGRLRVKRSTNNTEAYQLYLKGRYHYFKWTTEGFNRSIAYFEKAIALEPKYALAYAGVTDSCCALWYFGDFSSANGVEKGKQAALSALEIDDELAEVHSAMARVLCFHDWNWSAAEAEFRRAIELDPRYVTAREQYAFYLTAMGRFREAVVEARQAQELDPLSRVTNLSLGWILWFAGEYDEVMALAGKMNEFEEGFFGTHWILGGVHMAKHEYANACREIEKAVELGGGPMVVARLAQARGLAGDSAKAREGLERLRAISVETFVPAFAYAIVYSGLGENDQAFECLDQACRERNANLVYLNVDPTLQSLRSDPRYGKLLARVGLPG